MDSLIYAFIESTFTDEASEDIFKCFNLFEKFDYKDAESEFIDILNNASYATPGDSQDMFVFALNRKMDYIVNQHCITLSNETTLEQKVEICTAFYNFQHLENYISIISVLESFEPDHVKLSSIISDISNLDQVTVLSVLENVGPKLLSNMKKYIYSLEKNIEPDILNSTVLNKAKMFYEFLNVVTIGETLIRDGVIPGESFETYLTFCEDDLVSKDDEFTAKNILSVLMMSADGSNSPLMVYKKYSFRLLQDLNKTSKIETHVLRLLNNFEDFKKAKDEKDRLSKTSYTK